jgi:plasmid stabilization system protein ParE
MKVRYKARALRDLEGILEYISQFDRQAAIGVVRRIERSISRLLILPMSGRSGPKGTRILVVPGLPYVVIHRVGEDFVDIIAIVHIARRRRS